MLCPSIFWEVLLTSAGLNESLEAQSTQQTEANGHTHRSRLIYHKDYFPCLFICHCVHLLLLPPRFPTLSLSFSPPVFWEMQFCWKWKGNVELDSIKMELNSIEWESIIWGALFVSCVMSLLFVCASASVAPTAVASFLHNLAFIIKTVLMAPLVCQKWYQAQREMVSYHVTDKTQVVMKK